MSRRQHYWTPEEDTLLLRLRAKGVSNTQIGLRMNLGRGAVAGRWARLHGRGQGSIKHYTPKSWNPNSKPPSRWTESALTARWKDRHL